MSRDDVGSFKSVKKERHTSMQGLKMGEGEGGDALVRVCGPTKLAVLLGVMLLGTACSLFAMEGSRSRVVLAQEAHPQLVPLPHPRVWHVPTPAMMPGRLQQILKGVSSLDSELRHFDIKTGDWQELMTVSLKHARNTIEDLQLQSKRAREVKDQVKAFLSSPGPQGPIGPMGEPGCVCVCVCVCMCVCVCVYMCERMGMGIGMGLVVSVLCGCIMRVYM